MRNFLLFSLLLSSNLHLCVLGVSVSLYISACCLVANKVFIYMIRQTLMDSPL